LDPSSLGREHQHTGQPVDCRAAIGWWRETTARSSEFAVRCQSALKVFEYTFEAGFFIRKTPRCYEIMVSYSRDHLLDSLVAKLRCFLRTQGVGRYVFKRPITDSRSLH
jgi:hypothetical protein